MPLARLRCGILVLSLIASGCREGRLAEHERLIRLPGGKELVAEVLTKPDDMARGMMFRDQLPPDRALLFVHERESTHGYWMHNVKVPLDILWLNDGRRIVEISAHTPPCADKPPEACPSYGGKRQSRYVIELAGGRAAELGLTEGVILDF